MSPQRKPKMKKKLGFKILLATNSFNLDSLQYIIVILPFALYQGVS
jgi:hypothetical protein